jgi:hypothetical protein
MCPLSQYTFNNPNRFPSSNNSDYNLVVQGSEESVYKHKNWLGLNTGNTKP